MAGQFDPAEGLNLGKEGVLSYANRDERARFASPKEAGGHTYDRIAPFYDLLDAPHEFGWRRRLRREVFAGLAGRILDAGAGTGANVPFYPPGTEIHAIDASGPMLQRARARAERAGRDVAFGVFDLRNTPFPDRHFDAIVSTFVFCVLDDDAQLPALQELRRLCRPSGEIRLVDYRLSRRPVVAAAMKAVNAWSGRVFNSRYCPTTEVHIEPAGLEVVGSRFLLGDLVKLLVLRPRP